MKKIFTLLTLALACVMQLSAQKLQITNGGEVVDCSTVGVITYTDATQMGRKVSLGSRTDPTITNISDQTITVDALFNTGNPGVFSWCGFDNFCTVVTDKAEKDGIVLAPGESKTMDLHTEVTPGAYGTYTASVVFWEGYDKLATIQLKYIYTEDSGINDVKAEGQNVSVQNNTLCYSFNAAAARTINVYSIDGKLAKSLNTNSQQGQLSLGGLQQGVYLYTISQAGQQVATGKALVK